ncbi:hypothetical protein CK203_032721 [Vitis vinifera]|uniref:Uncharacterized protein n=1 Tax=Vitis vinifera TaxID=29760 RepID=A0A438I8K3_VITVI|nr:hypothetical protein CK203_032721 [Vitis vinifera]
MYHLLVQCQPDSGRKSSLSKRVNAIISVRIRQSYQTRATDWCHLLVVEQESSDHVVDFAFTWGLFWSKRVDPKQIIYLSWTDQGVLNLGKDTWREIPHNAPLIRLLLSDQVTFWLFSALAFSCLRCTFATAILAIDHRSSLSSLPTLDLFPMDFFPAKEHSFLTPASFHISDNIPIQLTNDEALSSTDLSNLSLLEVLFIYTVKMNQKERFNLSAHISSLQLVTGLPNPCKYWAKGHVLVSSPWNGSSVSPNEVFSPQRSLEIPSKERRGRLIEWVETASFVRLNKLFKIDTIEQAYKVLLSDKNLLALTEYP